MDALNGDGNTGRFDSVEHTISAGGAGETGGALLAGKAQRNSTFAIAARRYAIASIGCVAFALIYAQFSHDVYSPFMSFMFAIPLVGGMCVMLALYLAKAHPLPRATRQAWALALATLTVGSCLNGIFEIAGTASRYVVIYPIAAGLFALMALAALIRAHRSRRFEQETYYAG